ncbi:MAG: lamin tail domain-containing protein [Pseudomonadota bacterium]
MNGNVVNTLEKELGGFFVGPSPELQMALGTIAYFESEAGRYSHDATGIKDDRKPVELMNGKFHLVMYRNYTEAQERGDKIRSFWPKFIGPVTSTEADIVVPVKPTVGDDNDGPIRIVRALANPEGSDLGREWVAIESNSSMIVDLNGWTIRDKEDRRQSILGSIEPGKTRRIILDRATPQSAQLGNRGGRILLVDASGGEVAAVSYEAAASGAVQHFISE